MEAKLKKTCDTCGCIWYSVETVCINCGSHDVVAYKEPVEKKPMDKSLINWYNRIKDNVRPD